MSFKKNSSIEEIYDFLKPIVKKEEILTKFKDERIKGNELFFLEKEDFINLGFKLFKKLLNNLEEIKKNKPNILNYDENINEESTEEQVNLFLKLEINLSDEILEKIKNINGKQFFNLNEKDLINLNIKLGERKKILKYISSNKPKHQINITPSSSNEEICLFLKNKFNLPDNVIQNFKDQEIDGEQFFTLEESDLGDLEIDENQRKEIVEFLEKSKKMLISETKEKESDNTENIEVEEEQINEEEVFHHFLLIEVVEYITSEEEINKCPFNHREGFAELCKYMNIETKENCSTINYDQANNYKLKSATLWGTKDALFQFFDKRKMNKSLDFFKNKANSSGIYLLIKEDKSFAYIVIWPGKMTYLYRRMDEPQKDLLLSLVRTGFTLSNNNIISLTEKEQNEFDFQATKYFNSGGTYKSTVGEVKFQQNSDDFFKIEDDLDIKYQKEEFGGELKEIKTNNSSVFLYISTKETINSEEFDKIPMNKLNFNIKNVCFDSDFNLSPDNLYKFLNYFDFLKNMMKEEKNIINKDLVENKLKRFKSFYIDSFSKYIEKIEKINKFSCEICKKNNNKKILYIFSCFNHSFHIVHEECIIKDNNLQNEYKLENIKFELKKENNFNHLFFFYNKLIVEKAPISEPITKIFIFEIENIEKKIKDNNYNLEQLKTFLKNLKNNINKNKEEIVKNEKEFQDCYDEYSIKWKNNIIKKINELTKSKADQIITWYVFKSCLYDQREKQYLFTYRKYTKNIPKVIVKLFTFFKYNNDNNYLLKNKESNEWNEDEFENYFLKENHNGILIKKNNENNKLVQFKNKSYKFNGCYDYDYKNKIFVLSNFENEEECILVVHLDENNKITNTKSDYKDFNNMKLIKIQTIPFNYEDSSNYGLFYTCSLIYLVNIKDFRTITYFDLKSKYYNYKFNQ